MKKYNPVLWDFGFILGMVILALFWGAIAAVSFYCVSGLLK